LNKIHRVIYTAECDSVYASESGMTEKIICAAVPSGGKTLANVILVTLWLLDYFFRHCVLGKGLRIG
jgi:hypothetical protein